MDVDDVSNVSQYTHILKTQHTILKNAITREGELPTDRKTRGEVIRKHQMFSMQATNPRQSTQQGAQIYSSFLPPPYPPSTTSLNELTPIYIKDLKLGIHHRGSYLLVRSVTSPNRMTAIIVVVEDERDDAIVLQLFQQPDEDVQPASSIVTIGDVFLIKEPFLKLMADGEYGLRVDHVSDILRVDAGHRMWSNRWSPHQPSLDRTPDDLKQEGNLAMRRKQHWAAIRR